MTGGERKIHRRQYRAHGTVQIYLGINLYHASPICDAGPGELCVVWPDDANNDGIDNYGDRKVLNTYIFDAERSMFGL